MPERSAEEIQRDIERARESLASAVDQLAQRTSPKRAVDQAKDQVVAFLKSTPGKAVLGGGGALVVIVVVRKIRN